MTEEVKRVDTQNCLDAGMFSTFCACIENLHCLQFSVRDYKKPGSVWVANRLSTWAFTDPSDAKFPPSIRPYQGTPEEDGARVPCATDGRQIRPQREDEGDARDSKYCRLSQEDLSHRCHSSRGRHDARYKAWLGPVSLLEHIPLSKHWSCWDESA